MSLGGGGSEDVRERGEGAEDVRERGEGECGMSGRRNGGERLGVWYVTKQASWKVNFALIR